MSLAYLVCSAVLAIALVVFGHLLWRRRQYALAVLAAVFSAVSVFCLVTGSLLIRAGM